MFNNVLIWIWTKFPILSFICVDFNSYLEELIMKSRTTGTQEWKDVKGPASRFTLKKFKTKQLLHFISTNTTRDPKTKYLHHHQPRSSSPHRILLTTTPLSPPCSTVSISNPPQTSLFRIRPRVLVYPIQITTHFSCFLTAPTPTLVDFLCLRTTHHLPQQVWWTRTSKRRRLCKCLRLKSIALLEIMRWVLVQW